MIIYLIENVITNKIYIGQTVNTISDRFSKHKYDAKTQREPNSYFHNVINKYGYENFKLHTIATAKSQEELDKLEMWYIEFFQSTNREIGYNIENGGHGCGKVSNSFREKMRTIGLNRSDETKKKYSIAATGRKHTEETKKKLSEKRKDYIPTEETNKKISNSLVGNTRKLGYKDSSETRLKKSMSSRMAPCVNNETVSAIRLDYDNGMSTGLIVKKYGIKYQVAYNIVKHLLAYRDK